MTKQELIDELTAERRVIVTALNFSYIVASGAWKQQFRTYSLSEGEIELSLDSSKLRYVIQKPSDLALFYEDPKVVESDCSNLTKVTFRNAVTQYYEKIQAFCKGDRVKQQKWDQAPWRPLARIARNSMSHDFILNFWDSRKQQLRGDVRFTFPSGRKIEIKNTENGRPISGDNLPLEVVIELLDVMRDFVDKEL